MNESDRIKPEHLRRHKKILFLDLDGVIHGLKSPNLDAIQNLRKVVQTNSVNIVITSTWRKGNWAKSRSDIEVLMAKIGWDKPPIIGRTPDLSNDGLTRGDEIQNWLDRNPTESYVILDDDLDFLPQQMQNLVHVDPLDGIKPEDVIKLEKIFTPI